jgi:hypothetical protein
VGFFRRVFLGFIGRVFLLPTLDPGLLKASDPQHQMYSCTGTHLSLFRRRMRGPELPVVGIQVATLALPTRSQIAQICSCSRHPIGTIIPSGKICYYWVWIEDCAWFKKKYFYLFQELWNWFLVYSSTLSENREAVHGLTQRPLGLKKIFLSRAH